MSTERLGIKLVVPRGLLEPRLATGEIVIKGISYDGVKDTFTIVIEGKPGVDSCEAFGRLQPLLPLSAATGNWETDHVLG